MTTPPLIRELDPAEAPLVAHFYREAPDYWLLADSALDPDRKAQEFFTDAPPNSDPDQSHRLGLFLADRLSGVAELSFGFPTATDAYLGLMLLGPWARNLGNGRVFLRRCEDLARGRDAKSLYLAVLEANPRGRAFWECQGFKSTGLSGSDPNTGHVLYRLVKQL